MNLKSSRKGALSSGRQEGLQEGAGTHLILGLGLVPLLLLGQVDVGLLAVIAQQHGRRRCLPVKQQRKVAPLPLQWQLAALTPIEINTLMFQGRHTMNHCHALIVCPRRVSGCAGSQGCWARQVPNCFLACASVSDQLSMRQNGPCLHGIC